MNFLKNSASHTHKGIKYWQLSELPLSVADIHLFFPYDFIKRNLDSIDGMISLASFIELYVNTGNKLAAPPFIDITTCRLEVRAIWVLNHSISQ